MKKPAQIRRGGEERGLDPNFRPFLVGIHETLEEKTVNGEFTYPYYTRPSTLPAPMSTHNVTVGALDGADSVISSDMVSFLRQYVKATNSADSS